MMWLFVKNLGSFRPSNEFFMLFKLQTLFCNFLLENWMVKTLQSCILLEKLLVLAKWRSFWCSFSIQTLFGFFCCRLDGKNLMTWQFVGKVASFGEIDEFFMFFYKIWCYLTFCWKLDGENLFAWQFQLLKKLLVLAKLMSFSWFFIKSDTFNLLLQIGWYGENPSTWQFVYNIDSFSQKFFIAFNKIRHFLQRFAWKTWHFVKNLATFGKIDEYFIFFFKTSNTIWHFVAANWMVKTLRRGVKR